MAQGRIADRVAIVTGGGIGNRQGDGGGIRAGRREGHHRRPSRQRGRRSRKRSAELSSRPMCSDPKQVERAGARGLESSAASTSCTTTRVSASTSPLLEHTDELYLKTIRIDLDGVFWGLRYAGKVMVAQKRGAIINTASVAGIRGSVGLSAYNAAKHGVVGLTRNAALEFAPFGRAGELRMPRNHRYAAGGARVWAYRGDSRNDASLPSARAGWASRVEIAKRGAVSRVG